MTTPIKLSDAMVAILMPRLQDEMNASYLYRAASNWCKDKGFFKAAAYFAKESADELTHAKKLEDYMIDWNVNPILPPIPSPAPFTSLAEIIEKAYGIEYALYQEYENTSKMAFDVNELCVFDLLQDFRTKQKNSVAEYSDMINMLEGVNVGDKFQMLMLEEELFGA